MPGPTLQISYSLSNIENTAYQLWQYGHKHRIWVFSGDMGAGKTTLIRHLCQLIGVSDKVSSPSFSLINEYVCERNTHNNFKSVLHMDWYRLTSTEEAIHAGIEDAVDDTRNRCLIEWPEKAPELLYNHTYLHIRITLSPNNPEDRFLSAAVVGSLS